MEMIRIENGIYDWQGFHLTIDVAVPANSITAVLGPSGAGKSTLLNLIAGFETLSSGNIVLHGVEHSRTPPAQRPVSFVFQDNNTFAHMSARDNVAIGISPSLQLTDKQKTEVDDALAKVELTSLANRKPADMSGGERQRIALARVLVRKRPILLLDEAFAALGPALRKDMLELVQNLQRQLQLTVLMVTHQPEDATTIADRIIFVGEGQVHQAQPVSAFLNSEDKTTRNYLD